MKVLKRFEIGDKIYDPLHKRFGEVVGRKHNTVKYKIAWLVYETFPTYNYEVVSDAHKLNRYQMVEPEKQPA